MEGDLEKSRKQLMEQGFVDKDNFDEDPDSNYNKETFRKMVPTSSCPCPYLSSIASCCPRRTITQRL
jgi:hypothetical protein